MIYEVRNAKEDVRNQLAGWQVRGTKWKIDGLDYGFWVYSHFEKNNTIREFQFIIFTNRIHPYKPYK